MNVQVSQCYVKDLRGTGTNIIAESTTGGQGAGNDDDHKFLIAIDISSLVGDIRMIPGQEFYLI